MRYLLRLPLLVVALTVPFLAGAEPTKEDIARFIKQLGSDAFTEREEASKQLAAIGEPALEQLKQSADANDIEVRRRVRELIKAIEVPPFVVKGETAILGMALSPDGLRMLTVDADIVLRLWDAHSGQELRLLVGHTESISSVAFSPHGAQAISGGGRYRGHDFIVRLWTVDGGKEEKQMQGHTAEVTSVAFLPDGKHAVSGSCDKTIRLWDSGDRQGSPPLRGPHAVGTRHRFVRRRPTSDFRRRGPYPALVGYQNPQAATLFRGT